MYDKDFLKNILKNLIDQLNRFLIIIFLILFIISFFFKNFYLDLTKILILIIIIYRLFSKNKMQREKENNLYKKINNFLLKPFSILIRNIKDKEYVYKKCPKCKTILKLPLPEKRGLKHAKCPNCQKRLTFLTLKKVKIEIIKKSKEKRG